MMAPRKAKDAEREHGALFADLLAPAMRKSPIEHPISQFPGLSADFDVNAESTIQSHSFRASPRDAFPANRHDVADRREAYTRLVQSGTRSGGRVVDSRWR